MKKAFEILSFVFLFSLIACETTINPELQSASPLLVVDAWLTAQPKEQVILLSKTQPYFENVIPPAVSNASITVINNTDGRIFQFLEEEATGKYKWLPVDASDSLGTIGDEFSLVVQVGTDEYISASKIGRVPAIDSVTFTFEKASGFFPDYYSAEFWAKDPPGQGDAYWIKAWKNDTLLLKPSEISLAFDAGFSERGNVDGITFIAPIRQSISPFDTDDDGQLISPYEPGDSVHVEILSITKASFNFLNEVTIQTNRPGGFGELFASPIANVPTNIVNTNPKGSKAVGFFNVGAVTSDGEKLVE